MAGSNAEAGLKKVLDKAGVRGAERQRIERQLSSTETALGIFQEWKDAPLEKLQAGQTGMTQPNLLAAFRLYVDPRYGSGGHETYKVNIRPVLQQAEMMRSPLLIAAINQLWGNHARLEEARNNDRADTMRDPAAAFVGLEDAVKVAISMIDMVQLSLIPLPTGMETYADLRGRLARVQGDVSQDTPDRYISGRAMHAIIDNVFSVNVATAIQALDNAR